MSFGVLGKVGVKSRSSFFQVSNKFLLSFFLVSSKFLLNFFWVFHQVLKVISVNVDVDQDDLGDGHIEQAGSRFKPTVIGKVSRSNKRLRSSAIFEKGSQEISELLSDLGMSQSFKELFKLFGINSLSDFEYLDERGLLQLESLIQSNKLPGVDLTMKSTQLTLLGFEIQHGQLPNFTIPFVDRLKILTKLPDAAKDKLQNIKLGSLMPKKMKISVGCSTGSM